jgi:hypothetical protein
MRRSDIALVRATCCNKDTTFNPATSDPACWYRAALPHSFALRAAHGGMTITPMLPQGETGERRRGSFRSPAHSLTCSVKSEPASSDMTRVVFGR